jgi:hypothetical protein
MVRSARFGLAIAAIILLPTPAAHADDDSYLHAVDAAGVRYGSAAAMISTGQKICSDLRAGVQIPDVLRGLAGQGFPLFEQGTLLGAASYNLCPDTALLVHRYAQANGGAGA